MRIVTIMIWTMVGMIRMILTKIMIVTIMKMMKIISDDDDIDKADDGNEDDISPSNICFSLKDFTKFVRLLLAAWSINGLRLKQ